MQHCLGSSPTALLAAGTAFEFLNRHNSPFLVLGLTPAWLNVNRKTIKCVLKVLL